MIKIVSKKNKELTQSELVKISFLKKTFWEYSIKSQISFLKKNYKKNDIHNLFYKKKKLIGYNSLKIRKHSNFRYSIFDSFIIHHRYRDKKQSLKLMNFNKKKIKELKITSFLVCKKKLFSFYKKTGWKKIDDRKYKIFRLKKNFQAMIFNDKKIGTNILTPIIIKIK